MKLGAAQPASLEAIPEQDRIHLPGKFIDSPDAVVLNDFTSCVERQAVELAKCVNFIPMLADIAVLQGHVIRPVGAPAWSAAARIKALPLHHEFGDARDRVAYPPRLI